MLPIKRLLRGVGENLLCSKVTGAVPSREGQRGRGVDPLARNPDWNTHPLCGGNTLCLSGPACQFHVNTKDTLAHWESQN